MPESFLQALTLARVWLVGQMPQTGRDGGHFGIKPSLTEFFEPAELVDMKFGFN